MRNYIYPFFLGAGLFCLILAGNPCLAGGSGSTSVSTTTGSGSGSGSATSYDIGPAAPGTGFNQSANQSNAAGYGNVNVPFSDYGNQTINQLSNEPFDKLPILDVNVASNGQTIYDYVAGNNGEEPAAGTAYPGTYKQIPAGRTPVNPSQESSYPSTEGTIGVTGLPLTSTAIQAGALPNGGYSFPALPISDGDGKHNKHQHHFDYGFDPDNPSKQYGGSYNAANTPTGAAGGNTYSYARGTVGSPFLPATSTGSVDINTVDLKPLSMD